jgi:hypothetical protein
LSDFVDDDTSVPLGKLNLHPLQLTDDPVKWVTKDDWNVPMQALYDLRRAQKHALWAGFRNGASAAVAPAGEGRFRYNAGNGAHGAMEFSVDGQAYVAIGGAGADGKSLRSGAGTPSNGLGADGDFYIDTTNVLIFGPKASGAWPAGVSIVGPSGRTILNGSGAPSNGSGANGDYYIDNTAHAIYGPKAAGVWPGAVSLIGPTGATGAAGAASSVPGPAGADGKSLRTGAGAPSGGLGVDGDTYIDTTAKTFYGPKSGGAWGSGTSIIGPAGAAGAPGATGAAGAAGAAGTNGTNGTNGSNGTNGTNGADGRTIYNGTGAPGGGLGVNGDYYYDTAAVRWYGPKTAARGARASRWSVRRASRARRGTPALRGPRESRASRESRAFRESRARLAQRDPRARATPRPGRPTSSATT